MSKRTDRYAAAIRDLDQQKQAGQITEQKWELMRGRLVAEANGPRFSIGVRVLIWFGIVLVALVILATFLGMWQDGGL